MIHEDQKVTVITGGARGIGGATSRLLAARGDHVVLNDHDPQAARVAREEITSAGGACTLVIGDISDPAVVQHVVEAATTIGDRIDVLVNNVGDFRPASRDFRHSRPEHWQRLYELNLQHVLAVTHAALPLIPCGGTSSIVNVATVEAFRGIPANAAYSGFNAGVVAFTRSLAVELARDGIRVNAIAPDLTDTDQTPVNAMLRGRDPELVRHWVPMGRFLEPGDAASVVEFLTSNAARMVTGHTVPVDGGTLAASGWYWRHDDKGWTNMPDQP